MFNYENFKNKLKHFSEEKINHLTYTYWHGNTLLILAIVILIQEVLIYTIGRIDAYLYLFICLITIITAILYLTTRKSGCAITDNHIVYVIFSHITFKEKKVYEIIKDKIKSISIHRILHLCFVSISFIDETKRLTTKKFYFSTFILGPDAKKFQSDSKIVYEELKELQKKIDRGDF